MRLTIIWSLLSVLLAASVQGRPVKSAHPFQIDGFALGESPSESGLKKVGFSLIRDDKHEGYRTWQRDQTLLFTEVKTLIQIFGKRVSLENGKAFGIGQQLSVAKEAVGGTILRVDSYTPDRVLRCTAPCKVKYTMGFTVQAKKGKIFKITSQIRRIKFEEGNFWGWSPKESRDYSCLKIETGARKLSSGLSSANKG